MSRSPTTPAARHIQRIAGITAITTALSIAPAAAAAPTTTGWWTALPIALAPDAPEGSIVVESGPDSSPISFGALSYPVSEDAEHLTLTLFPSEDAMSTPTATLIACQLIEDFEHATGGPMSEAPDYNCDISATATAYDDGAEYEFDLEGFGTDGGLGVAILVAGPAQRIVIAAPGAHSLRTTKASEPVASPPSAGQPDQGGDAAIPATATPSAPRDDYAMPTSSPAFSAPTGLADPVLDGVTDDGAADERTDPRMNDLPVASPTALAVTGDSPSAPETNLLVSVVVPLALVAGLVMWLRAGRHAVANATTSDLPGRERQIHA